MSHYFSTAAELLALCTGARTSICAAVSFFGNPGPNFSLGGGGSDLEPTKTQSNIGGIIFLAMAVIMLIQFKKKKE